MAALAAALVSTAVVLATDAAPAAAGPASPAAYVAVTPCRLADTRSTAGFTRVDAQTIEVTARNVCAVPAAATSLALTLTIDSPVSAGFLTAWPSGQSRPTVSNLNFDARQVRANGSITRVDSAGRFRVFTSVATDVVVDVVGAFVPASTATSGRFVSRPPTRLFDSRDAGPKPSPGANISVPRPSVVPGDAIALALNITLTESTAAGFVTEFPAGQPKPMSSILNADTAGQTRAAAGIFPISAAGIGLYLSGGGHVIVDLLGYFTGPSSPGSSDGLFTAYDPTRMLDTRTASPLGNGVPLYAGGGTELAVAQGGAMAYNITSVEGDPGYVTAYPAGTERPSTSTVNSTGGGDTVANFSITQVSNRGLGLYGQQRTHVLADLQGWFSGPSATATLPPPANVGPPPQTPSFSACTHEGMSSINATRSSAGAVALTANANADDFACGWAMQLAQGANGLDHSPADARTAAVGCPTGENVAWSSGNSSAQLMTNWYASPAHMANIKNPSYRSVGIAFIIRTEVSGAQSIWGVTDFALC
jgi:hypothetical protein